MRAVEVACDVRLARAMLARARNDARGILTELGAEESYVPASRSLAMALRVEAHERLGDIAEARRTYRRASRGAAFAFGATINAYGLAPRTRQRSMVVGFLALGLIGVAFGGMGLALSGEMLGAVATIFATIVAAIILKQF
jgi:hypothetical protein